MDRASIFSDDAVLDLLRTRFVLVALDVSDYQRRRDPQGRFFRKVVYQRRGMRPGLSTQGFYLFTPEGKLLQGWNNRDVQVMKRKLRAILERYPSARSADLAMSAPEDQAILPGKGDTRVEAFSRILEARWPPAREAGEELLRSSRGRDSLHLTPREVESLAGGQMPQSLLRKIVRFHLVDNTRGEAPSWKLAEVRQSEVRLIPEDGGLRLEGKVSLETAAGDRGYQASLAGIIETRAERVTRFDLLARGEFWGEGPYTPNAPPGRFTLAVAFALAEGRAGDRPPLLQCRPAR